MSASWRSDLMRRRAAPALLACALAWCVPAAASAARDTTRVVKQISVGPAGIQIDHGSPEAIESVNADRNDTSGVRVRTREDGNTDVQIFGHKGAIVIDGEGTGIMRVFSDAEVAPGEHVDGDVVVIVGSIKVAGEVSGNVVALGGAVELLPGASVDGDAVAIGGGLHQSEGATVSGESVSIGFFPLGAGGLPALTTMLVSVVVGWAVSLFLAWIFGMLFRDRLVRVATIASRRTAASFFLGLFSAPLVGVAFFLLCITVVGIPIAILLPVFYILVVWAGQLAATYVLGCKLLRRPLGEGGTFAPFALGALFVAAFFIVAALVSQPPGLPRTFALFLTALGGLTVFGLSTIGTGAMFLSRFGSLPRNAPGEPAPAPAPPYAVPLPPYSGGPATG